MRRDLLQRWLMISLVACQTCASHGAQKSDGASTPPSPAAVMPQPITALFRQLLVATTEEQKKLLGTKQPQTRAVLESKLKEYRALPPQECEQRLRVLDLRWYLTQLKSLSPSQRQERLALVPETDRALVEERLAFWDRLPQPLQRQVWEYDIARRMILAPRPSTPPPLPGNPALHEIRIEQAVRHWQALPPQKQEQICGQFDRIFDLVHPDKTPTLNQFSPEERLQMSHALRALKNLPAEKRASCLRGFQQFTALSREERAQFLRNADLWQKLSPDEREVWNSLVRRLPPQPPGFEHRPNPQLPPTPRAKAEG